MWSCLDVRIDFLVLTTLLYLADYSLAFCYCTSIYLIIWYLTSACRLSFCLALINHLFSHTLCIWVLTPSQSITLPAQTAMMRALTIPSTSETRFTYCDRQRNGVPIMLGRLQESRCQPECQFGRENAMYFEHSRNIFNPFTDDGKRIQENVFHVSSPPVH